MEIKIPTFFYITETTVHDSKSITKNVKELNNKRLEINQI
jgi:hypothetical protein